MPKSKRKCYSRNCKKRSKRLLTRRVHGGSFFPSIDNVIPYNQSLGTGGDPRDPSSMIDSRQLPNIITGGRKKRVKSMRRRSKKFGGGGLFNYDLLTGETYNQNAVQSINASSGTQHSVYKAMGMPQELGPTIKMDGLPSKALV